MVSRRDARYSRHMAAVDPHPHNRLASAAGAIRATFWVMSLGIIACYAFFAALGAFSPADVAPVTGLVGVLAVLWIVHAVLQRRHAEGADMTLRHARERRGF
jgi:purine-cytosine permease-like protein